MTLPKTMTAIAIEGGKGGPLVPAEIAVPTPGPGQILIKVTSGGVNRADLLQVQGNHPPPAGSPSTPGLEAAGTVAALGSGVSGWKAGDDICALLGGGGYAEYAIATEPCCLRVPKGVSLLDAGGIPEVYFTVWSNVLDVARLQPGDTFLVHGGSSGIGTAAIQLMAARGHRVFTTAGSAEKCAACVKLGAVRAINYRTEDFVEIVKAETGGKGVDVILDMVGGDYVARNYEAAAVEGRIVQIAVQAGAVANADFSKIMVKRLVHTGSTLRPRTVEFKAAIAAALEAQVWPLLGTRKVAPVMDMIFPLHEAWRAHERMEEGEHIGKLVLDVG
jgi:putative PIG3 family NAD(P)H quinone oxidoreductase